MTEILVKDTSLTAIADVIRSKARTTDPITFPAGFVSSISALLPGEVIKMAGGTFTPAENGETFTFSHGLGITPNFLLFTRVSDATDTYFTRGGLAVKTQRTISSGEEAVTTTPFMISTELNGDINIVESYPIGNKWDEEVCVATVATGSNTKLSNIAGITFSWVAGVIENLF